MRNRVRDYGGVSPHDHPLRKGAPFVKIILLEVL